MTPASYRTAPPCDNFCLFLFRHGREIIPWLLRRYLRPLLSSRTIREQELYPPYKDLRCFLPGPAVNLDRNRTGKIRTCVIHRIAPSLLCPLSYGSPAAFHGLFRHRCVHHLDESAAASIPVIAMRKPDSRSYAW